MANVVETDTVVVGLGAMGAQALWRLARRGIDAIGIEQFDPAHERGSSHGESRMIRTAYAEGEGYVPFIKEAWRAWTELEDAAGERLVSRTGAVMLGAPGAPTVRGAVEAAERHGLAYRDLSPAGLAREHPRYAMRPDEIGTYEEDAGVVFPEKSILAAVRLAEEAGARVWRRTPVTAVVPDPDRPRVRVGGTEVRARRVVVSAGAWLPAVLPGWAGRLRVERRVLGWFRTTDPVPHLPGTATAFARDEPDGTTWYGFPSLDGGRTVKFGIHAEGKGADREGAQWGEPVDPDTGPRAPDAADARRLGELAAGLRGLEPLPERMAACMYTMTPDEDFVIGPHRALPGLVLAGGFSGHGFKFASAVGAALADLAEHGRTDMPIAMFAPHRWDVR